MNNQMDELSKAKKDFELTLVTGIEEISEKEVEKKELALQVSKELGSLDEQELYSHSLSMLERNPAISNDDLVYSMANEIKRSTNSKFLKKAAKAVMKERRKKAEK